MPLCSAKRSSSDTGGLVRSSHWSSELLARPERSCSSSLQDPRPSCVTDVKRHPKDKRSPSHQDSELRFTDAPATEGTQIKQRNQTTQALINKPNNPVERDPEGKAFNGPGFESVPNGNRKTKPTQTQQSNSQLNISIPIKGGCSPQGPKSATAQSCYTGKAGGPLTTLRQESGTSNPKEETQKNHNQHQPKEPRQA